MMDGTAQKHTVCIALGANIGDRLAAFEAARRALSSYMAIEVVSKIYETDPVYAMDQPVFLNAALVATTELSPQALLFTVKEIEREIGRTPTFRFGPRVIDIDIVFYDNLDLHTPELTVPHLLMQERMFVLRPVADVAPHWAHPKTGKTVLDMLAEAPDKDSVRLFRETWPFQENP